jgi:hypothetical protein
MIINWILIVQFSFSEALANINTTTPSFPPYSAHAAFAPVSGRAGGIGATVAPHSLHSSVRSWDFKAPNSYPSPPCEDSFMSWDPSRRSTDWAQPSGL